MESLTQQAEGGPNHGSSGASGLTLENTCLVTGLFFSSLKVLSFVLPQDPCSFLLGYAPAFYLSSAWLLWKLVSFCYYTQPSASFAVDYVSH